MKRDAQIGHGVPATFLHANGFPPAAYRPFLSALGSQVRISAYAMRPLHGAPLDRSLSWWDVGTALAEQVTEPSIAIGHSIGAAASVAAVLQAPERFLGLVLVEPVSIQPALAWLARNLPYGLVQRLARVPIATLKQRQQWPDTAAFLDSCKRSGIYEQFSPEALQIFADAALERRPDGVHLRFPKDWEAHFYTRAPWLGKALRSVARPVVGLRGQDSMFMNGARWAELQTAQPGGWFHQMPTATHLLPLEFPEEAAQLVLDGLSAQGLLPRERVQVR